VLGADAGIRVRRVNCRCAADTRRSRTPAPALRAAERAKEA
jgi:hypothetical protein